MSVSKVMRKGNTVVLDEKGSYIYDNNTGDTIPVHPLQDFNVHALTTISTGRNDFWEQSVLRQARTCILFARLVTPQF